MTDSLHNAFEQSITMSGKPSGFRSLVGYHTTVWERDYAELELVLDQRHMNSLGILHGGVYMAMLDAVMGHAATWCAVEGNVRLCVTLSLTTSFLASATSGRIRAIGRMEGIHDRIGTVSGQVVDQAGALLATGQASFRYFPGSEGYDGVSKAHRR
jgi:uncharacterized protein (TIGR00369 family)